MPATETAQLSPEMALIARYRRREGTPEPELKVRPLARKITRASGHKFGEQSWRRRESGEVTDISDKDVAWMAWGVDLPADKLAATGRTTAADLLRQIITDQQAKAAQPDADGPDDDDLEGFFKQAVAEIDALAASPEEKQRMRAFLRQQIQQSRDAVDMLRSR